MASGHQALLAIQDPMVPVGPQVANTPIASIIGRLVELSKALGCTRCRNYSAFTEACLRRVTAPGSG